MIMIVSPLLSIAVSILLIFTFLLFFWRKQKKLNLLPPGPAPLPLLGTPKYVGEGAACKYFPELYRKYGPVFTIWKLMDPIVVLCGYEAVKDALLNQGEEFSGRPFSPVIDLYSDGYSFPSISGERWRQLRRFTITSLRNNGMGKSSMKRRVFDESKNLIQAVRETSGKPFNPLTLMSCAVGNITSYALLSKHFHYKSPELQEMIIVTRKFIANTHSTLHEIGNTFPFLLKIPFLQEKIFRESSHLKSFIKKYVEDHKRSLDPAAPRDFIDYFLLKIKEEENRSESNFSENSLIVTLMALLAAGTETTSRTLNFCLILISNYPEVQAKVQQEIDEVTGSAHAPEMMDRAQMPYTNAVVHEIQRVMDLAPVAHYHAVTEETQFRGFTIPKGTTVIPFISSVLSDPTQWETPEDFNPGHFLDEKGQFQLKPAFMAFSAGKRICAGESLARMEIFLLFSALLQKFTFTLPPGTGRQDCRMLKQNKHKAILFSQCFSSCEAPEGLINFLDVILSILRGAVFRMGSLLGIFCHLSRSKSLQM
ncbi:cytochrome P450 2C8-like isoform 3-T3 [Anomaloglossus baeobatrachus]|uniref:cytochrome P450 2C8-like isoform X1 n=1 Tax=Anomaloglossus baeobatrachus TaxID=238106 RepID=UPI003F502643